MPQLVTPREGTQVLKEYAGWTIKLEGALWRRDKTLTHAKN